MSTAESDSDRDRHGDAITIPGDYQHRARTRGFVVQRYWHWEKERVIRKFSRPLAGETALDVGSGSGVIANVLAELGADTLGIDGNPAAVAYAEREFSRPGLRFRRALIEDIALAPESFDRVYCLEIIEHLFEPQVRRLMQALHRATKVGGVLTITTPNYHGTWPVLERALDASGMAPKLAGSQHVTRFDRRRLHTLLSDAGWTIERATTFSTFAPFVSALSWRLAERVSEVEDRMALPFGNLLLVVARRS